MYTFRQRQHCITGCNKTMDCTKCWRMKDFEVHCWNNAGSLSKMDIFWKLGQPINQENLTKMRIKGGLWDTRTFMLKRLKVHDSGFHLRVIVSVLHQNEGGIGKSIPDAQEISRDPREFPNTSLVLVEHGYNVDIVGSGILDKPACHRKHEGD